MEHMQKVSKDEVKSLTYSMGVEWGSVLSAQTSEATLGLMSPKDEKYWSGERAAKVRRVQSLPTTPARR